MLKLIFAVENFPCSLLPYSTHSHTVSCACWNELQFINFRYTQWVSECAGKRMRMCDNNDVDAKTNKWWIKINVYNE
jgi:hypothetical protein